MVLLLILLLSELKYTPTNGQRKLDHRSTTSQLQASLENHSFARIKINHRNQRGPAPRPSCSERRQYHGDWLNSCLSSRSASSPQVLTITTHCHSVTPSPILLSPRSSTSPLHYQTKPLHSLEIPDPLTPCASQNSPPAPSRRLCHSSLGDWKLEIRKPGS